MNLLDAAYALSIGPHYCWHRFVTGKYGPQTPEKTGKVPDRFKGSVTAALGVGDPHYEQPCLWLHAVSVGEVNASVELAGMFTRDNPRWDLRISTTTATGRDVAQKHFGEPNVFYYPLDFSWMVKRAFDRVRPALIVLMELEIWPNFLAEAARRKIPVAVANARITERSVKRLSYVPNIARTMAESVEAWFAQTQQYADRLMSIGVPANRIEVTGSVKYDAVPLELDPVTGQHYRRLFGAAGGRLLVVAGSTHPGEETAVLDACRKIEADTGRRTRVVLVPRHPQRLDEVEAEAGKFGRVIRRSALAGQAAPESGEEFPADIVLVDVMGELAKIYAAADLVFVGGTLTNRGGQNFMEPCGLGKATVVGPNLWNFAEPADLLGKGGGLRIVQDAGELARTMSELAASPAAAAAMGEAARKLLLNQRGAAQRMAERLNLLAKAATRR